MNVSLEKEISKTIFEMSEQTIYQMMENLKQNNAVDQSLVYCFMKAFYLHTAKLYLESQKAKVDFHEMYKRYQEYLKNYYKINNPDLEEDLLVQLKDVQKVVVDGDVGAIAKLCEGVISTLGERNRLCAINK